MPKPTVAEKIVNAERMRQNPTPAEAALWSRIGDGSLGATFVRQELICGWIADFYCEQAAVVIEVDGGYHKYRFHEDAVKDFVIARKGIHVVRLTNEEVLNDINGCVKKIIEAVYLQRSSDGRSVGKRRVPLTHGKLIGLIIKRLRDQGFSNADAVVLAFKIAQE